MTTNNPAILVSRAPASAVPPVVRARTAVTAALTAGALAVGAAFGLAFGTTGLALYAFALPVPLCLAWLSADVTRADEREPTSPATPR
ncbi:MAG: hypothetical protein KF850_21740 [Labilithrix sp.]|nr:hypothetical protein [Labilithrix sp.]